MLLMQYISLCLEGSRTSEFEPSDKKGYNMTNEYCPECELPAYHLDCEHS